MHWRRLAPELSATSRLLSICIIAGSPSPAPSALRGRMANGEWRMGPSTIRHWPFAIGLRCASRFSLHHDPSLVLRDGPALLDEHHVADLVGVGLVVGMKLLRPAHRLLEQRMGEALLHL